MRKGETEITFADLCLRCGACCKVIDCKYLKDNLCLIYERRPTICRVDKMAELKKIPKEEYYKMAKKACKLLRGEK